LLLPNPLPPLSYSSSSSAPSVVLYQSYGGISPPLLIRLSSPYPYPALAVHLGTLRIPLVPSLAFLRLVFVPSSSSHLIYGVPSFSIALPPRGPRPRDPRFFLDHLRNRPLCEESNASTIEPIYLVQSTCHGSARRLHSRVHAHTAPAVSCEQACVRKSLGCQIVSTVPPVTPCLVPFWRTT
jgi:hypothetical protein